MIGKSRPVTRATVSDLAHRPVKAEVHALLAKVIHRNYLTKIHHDRNSATPKFTVRGRGKLRWLTLPGPDWCGERVFMSHLPQGIRRKVEEVVGIEHSTDQELLKAWKASARRLNTKHAPTVFTTCQTGDKHLFIPGHTHPRTVFAPERGFDMMWLDYCSPLTDSILCSLSLLAENISVFERAWAKGRPGLLFITLQMGVDFKSALNTLDWVHHNMELPDEYLRDSYRLRASGLTELLNMKTKPLGFSCLPTHWMFYREELSDRQAARMYLLGFEVWKGQYETQPEYKRVVERRINT